MEKYNLHVSRDTLEKVKECVAAYIDHETFLPVEVLGDLVGSNLSCLFGAGDLGWSPRTLQHDFRVNDNPIVPYLSIPKPEEISTCSDGHTVREQMESLASRERPTLKDWLNKNGIGTYYGAVPYEKAYMQDALAILRRMVEDRRYVCPEIVEQLTEMRTLIHALIGTGENCSDATDNEYPEAVRKATRLDAMDAFSYAIRALLGHKDEPGAKIALNSIYGAASDVASIDLEEMYPKELTNVKAEEPNALFVTIETGTFEVTPENVGAVITFISNAGEGRDIHLRVI